MNNKKNIRNFSIIAHIDHGKSTLADRLLELCNAVTQREMKTQYLDTMDLERERGITIKLNAVQLHYEYNNTNYQLNLIDTPGHVDFSYEVSRSLAASEGAILLVDSTQGVQPQTIANLYLAIENNLEIIIVINKIDMQNSDVEKTKMEIETQLGLSTDDAILVSAKTGKNVEKVLEAIIHKIPSPKANDTESLKALVFDSYFDSYKGIVLFVKVVQGSISKNDNLKFVHNGHKIDVVSVGVNTPKELQKEKILAGECGWITTTTRIINKKYVGDTLTYSNEKDVEPLKGYRPMKPMVFSGFYPIETEKFENLGFALEKISLSDSSLVYEKETSKALGFGYRVGFLGLLHMEIIQERIAREFNIELIATAPSVEYKVIYNSDEVKYIENPSEFPDRSFIKHIEEPTVRLTLFSPQEFVGKLMEFIHDKRGVYVRLDVVSETMNSLVYEMPLGEIVFDFFNAVKSISKGYASFDYEFIGYKKADLVKMDILVAKEQVDALSLIISRDKAYYIGRELVKRLKDIIPRQNFEVSIQAAIGGKIISRETIKAYRKDVTGYLYGGDISRKKKLLEKQKKGKKKMKQIGSVNIPQEAFVAILKK